MVGTSRKPGGRNAWLSSAVAWNGKIAKVLANTPPRINRLNVPPAPIRNPAFDLSAVPSPLIPALPAVHIVAQSSSLCCIRLLHRFGPAENHASASKLYTDGQNRSVRSRADLPDELFRLNRLKITLRIPT